SPRPAARADPGADATACPDEERVPDAGPGLLDALPALSDPIRRAADRRPESDREVRGATPGGHAGSAVLRRAGRALYLCCRRWGEVPGPHPGDLPEGPLRPGPCVPRPAGAGVDTAVAVGRRRHGGVPQGSGSAPGCHDEAVGTSPRA